MSAPLVTARQRVTQRTRAEQSMMDTCEVLQDATTDDNAGGQTVVEGVATTTVCGVQPIATHGRGSAEQVIMDRLGWMTGYIIRLPLATTVTPANRLRVNSTRTFEIGAVLAAGTLATVKTAICRELG